jgi:MFS family permease
MKKNNQRFPQKLLVIGILLLIIGGVLLLQSLGYFSFGDSWPLPFLVAGLVLLYLVYFKGMSTQYILPGMILALGGLFFFLLYTPLIPEKSLARIWPAFMVITGLSLIPYALKKRERTRIGIIISAIAMILLAALFFLFSLHITEIGFREFVFRWWPLIIIVIGLGLIFYNFFHYRSTDKKQK